MRITPKQIETVLTLAGPVRYKHFVRVVADQGRVVGLYNDGWALAGTADGRMSLPLWPAREYAELCRNGAWATFEVRDIDLHELLNRMIVDLRSKGIGLAIFPTPKDTGVFPDYDVIVADLRTELGRVE